MREIMKVDSIPKAFSFLTGIGSLGLVIYGMFGESYWSGFGLVLLMTSLLLIFSLSGAQRAISLESQKDRTISVRTSSPSSRKQESKGLAVSYQVKEA